MQETITTTPDDELPPSRPRRFRLIALGLVLTMFVPFAYVAYRNIADAISNPDPAPNPGFPEPDFSLTDEEAIQTFEQLSQTLRQSVSQRDPSLLTLVTTPDGDAQRRIGQEIQRLKEDGVIDFTRVQTEPAEVQSSTNREIRIREVIVLQPCFKSESGEDVTQADAVVEQTGTWILKVHDGQWLIDDTRLENDRVIDDSGAKCGG